MAKNPTKDEHSAKPKNKGGRPRKYTAEQKQLRGMRLRGKEKEAIEKALAEAEAKKHEPTNRDYAAVAEQYAKDVVASKVVANKWVRLACERHLNDLKRSKQDPDCKFKFDAALANKFCENMERYPHIKGRWAQKRELLRLEAWQCFCLAVPFGWLRKSNDKRRFRVVYLCVPRKNAKSTIAAGIGNNLLTIDGEHGAEVYSGATSEKQAWEVFGPARLMMQHSPKLQKEHGVEVMARSIVRMEDNSVFKPIIGNPGDGASPSCAIVDEYHEHTTSAMVDTMITGMGAREQPLLLVITTAGTDLASPCYDMQKDAEKVLEGVIENDEMFAIVYSIDEGDDWADPKSLRKANPNLGVSVDEEFLLAQQRQAVLNPAHQNRFKTKHLNVWCNASVAGINMHSWRLCADPQLSLQQFAGKRSWFAVDLASKSDLCAFVQLFVQMINGQRHYYAFSRNYLPEAAIEEPGPNQLSYRKWVSQLHLVATPGAEIDFDLVRDDVVAYSRPLQVEEIIYDPWRATQLAQQLRSQITGNTKVIEMAQNARNMGEAFDEFTAAIKNGRFHHTGCPVLEWCASNVVAKPVAKGLTLPAKEKQTQKIDPIVSIIMAIARAMVAQTEGIDGWLRSKPVMVAA